MIKLIRSQSPILMAILLALISLSFIVFYNVSSLQSLRNGTLGRIDGKAVNIDDFRIAQQATILDLTITRGGALPPGKETSDAVNQITWQRLLVLAAGRQFHSVVSDQEVVAEIQSAFSKDGQYDPAAYEAFVKNFLVPRSVGEDRFEQIVRDKLMEQKVIHAIVSPAQVTSAEVDHMIDLRLGSAKMSVVRLDPADFESQIAVTPADIAKEYQDDGSNPAYRTPERRTVGYATFLLSPADEKLPAKDKAAAKQKLGQAAQDFAIAALDKKDDPQAFAALAAQQNLQSGVTAPFALTEAPAAVPPSPAFNHAAFDLTSDVPVSDAIETDHGYYVLNLVKVDPSAPLPLAQVSPLIEKNLRENGALRQLEEKGVALAKEIRDAVAAGKPFATAAQDAAAADHLKVTVESLPPFIPMQASATLPDASALVPAAISLQPGEVGDFAPATQGGLIPDLEMRSPADATLATGVRSTATKQVLEARQQALFNDWLGAWVRKTKSSAPAFLGQGGE